MHRRRIVEVSRVVAPAPQPMPKHTAAPAQPTVDDGDGDDEEVVQVPLELWPTVRTLIGYGRRTHGMGALRGARALERLVDSLVPYAGALPELEPIIAEARAEAHLIRTLAGCAIESADKI